MHWNSTKLHLTVARLNLNIACRFLHGIHITSKSVKKMNIGRISFCSPLQFHSVGVTFVGPFSHSTAITWFRVQFGINEHEWNFQRLRKLHERSEYNNFHHALFYFIFAICARVLLTITSLVEHYKLDMWSSKICIIIRSQIDKKNVNRFQFQIFALSMSLFFALFDMLSANQNAEIIVCILLYISL